MLTAEENAERDSAPPNCALPSGSALHDYAFGVMKKLMAAKECGYEKDTRSVELIDLCGAIQLIQAGLPNLHDAERLDQLSRIGRRWAVRIDGVVCGDGHIRDAIDQAIYYADRREPNIGSQTQPPSTNQL